MSIDEQLVLADVKRVGIIWRQHEMSGDTEMKAFYDGMLTAFGDVLAWGVWTPTRWPG